MIDLSWTLLFPLLGLTTLVAADRLRVGQSLSRLRGRTETLNREIWGRSRLEAVALKPPARPNLVFSQR